MSPHQEKVLAHAARELAAASATEPAALLPRYQKFLKIENHRLRLRHQAGGGGREVCASRATLIDILLRNIFALASAAADKANGASAIPLSLVALGGYGRNELNPGSDVDLMFLHQHAGGEIPAAVSATAEQVLYFLWDVGFKVGHSTRSVQEAIAQANDEMLTKTAMLEARHLTGDADLYRLFRARFRKQCVQGHEKDYIAARMEDQARRHEKFANNVYLQEPNVKGGCGGLRDYQNLLWITYFKEGALTTTHLVGKDWLSASDGRRIDLAYDFLLRVRTQLHYTNKRATDVLYLNVQAEVAGKLGYTQKMPVHRSEAFMKDYYEHTRNIFRITERLTERFATGAATTTRRLFFPLLPRRKKAREERIGEFLNRDGQLHLVDPQLFSRDPEQLMKVFEHAQERGLSLSAVLTDQLSRRLRAVTREFRYAKAPREIFLRLLRRKGEGARVLRMMHEVDFLGSYLPEFGQLTCLVQHEYFHRYTADEHTLVCIEKLDALLETKSEKLQPYRRLLDALPDPFVLYLALLLHDTGKGVGARPHSEASALFAQTVAVRLQLTSEERRTLVLLVDHHVTLSMMAQQRNIDDPATVIEFANIVKTQSNLDHLMLLTLADGQGTTATWSDWKELLVWQLHRAASRYLQDQEAYISQSRIERAQLRAAVASKLSGDFADEIDAHFDYMPDNYFRAFAVEEIAAHLELFRVLWRDIYSTDKSPLVPVVRWEQPEQGHTVVSICTWDRQHLLERIAGAFTVASVNILSADIFIRGDNLVLDIFRVRGKKLGPVKDPREIALFEAILGNALRMEAFDFVPLLASVRRKGAKGPPEIDFPTRISIENKSHPASTLVEVETPDRLGLLHDLVACMGRQNVYITLARISTDKGAAVDTFYVTDATTRGKITDAKRIEQLQQSLHAAAVPAA